MKTRNTPMKTKAAILWGTMLFAGMATLRAALPPDLPTEFTYVLECRSTNAAASKCGYEQLAMCCPPLFKYYRQSDQVHSISVTLLGPDSNVLWSGSLADHTTERQVMDHAKCLYRTNILCEGNFSYTAEGDDCEETGSGSRTCAVDCDGWTVVRSWDGVAGETNYCESAMACYLHFFGECWQYNWNAYWFPPAPQACDYWDWTIDGEIWVEGYFVGVGANHSTTVLSSEFTTAELIGMVQCDPSGEWIPTGGESFHAKAEISSDEVSATVNAAEARFKVWCPAGEEFTIPYLECRTLFSNGVSVVVRTEKKITGTGTGDWQYTNVFIPVAFSTYTSNGCTFYRGEEAWIALGCAGNSGGCSSGSCGYTPGTVNASLGSVRVTMGLGAVSYGEGTASLVLAGSKPNPKLTTPQGLEAFGDLRGAVLFRFPSGAIQQVKSLLCLAEVVTSSATSYTVKFYDSAPFGGTGPYDTSGYTPFSTCTVEQVSSTNHIRVTVSNGNTTVYDYTWSAADNGWTLTSGGGIRKETRALSESPRVHTHTIKNAADNLLFQEIRRYISLGTNYYLAQRETGSPGAGLTNKWFYYDNPATDGTNYGKIKLTIEPGGFWRRYQYDQAGRLTNEVSQFLNAATNAPENQCRVVRYDYTSLDGTNEFEARIELLQGVEIAREYTVTCPGTTLQIRCTTPGASWTNVSNLVTISRLYGSGEFAGRIHSVISPDGTMRLYQYQRASGEQTTTVLSGQPNGDWTDVTNGMKTVTSLDEAGRLLSRYTYDIALGDSYSIDFEAYSHDALGRLTTTYYIDGTSTTVNYDCCGVESTVDRDGVTTSYIYDELHRQIGTLRNGITTTNLLDAAGNALAAIRVGTDGTTNLLRRAGYDTAGRLTSETNALTGVISYAQAFDGSGQTIKTTTFPDNGQRMETYYQDGSIRSVTGSAAFPTYYEYGVYDNGTWTKETKGSESGAEWVKTYTDMLGRTWKTEYPDNAASTNFYNPMGQLEKSVDPDGVTTLYTYNALGEIEKTILDMNRNGSGNDAVDRVTRQTNDVFVGDDYIVYRRSRTYHARDDGQEALVSEQWSTANHPNTRISFAYGLGTTNVTFHQYPTTEQRTETTTHPDGSQTVTVYTNGLLAKVSRYEANDPYNPITQTDYAYDAHGRLWQTIDARNGATTCGYNNADLMTTNTTPSPDGVQGGLVTKTFYDTSLRATNLISPDNTSAYTTYWTNGLPRKTWGSRIYPVEYAYDHAGRMTNMTTWQNFNEGTGQGTSGSAVTQWLYDSARGWLNQKKYNDNTGPSYSYTAAGRLASRSWARGITTSYTNNNAGELWVVDYSDSTPDVTYGYDRRGRQTNVVQSGGTTINRTLNDAGQVLVESYSGGPLNGLSVTNGYDEFLRRTNLSLLASSSQPLSSTAYAYTDASGYNRYSRLQTVSTVNAGLGTLDATYSYLANSPLVSQIAFATNGQTVMTTTKEYDFLNRLTNIVTLDTQPSTLSSSAYAYNAASQRTSVTNADNSYWVYTYDSMGQVTSGKKYWSNGTPVAGQQFDYTFDDIGNRKTTSRDTGQAFYTNNLLNQITGRTVPGYVNVTGTATNTARVLVNTTLAERQGDYYRAEVPVGNGAGPVWLTMTNVAVLTNASPNLAATVTGNVFVAKSPELCGYDADGNLTSDSLWTNTWNGENRRITIESSASLPAAARMKEQWTHLPDGRWIERIVSTNNGSAYSPAYTNRYVWDGQVLLAVLDHTNGLVLSFTRGLDLSGTINGAGGAGGLLWIMSHSTPVTRHCVAYDGNGNVTALINLADGAESARYEYGPFGEVIRATGPMAKVNPFRFLTQYQDEETDLLMYLHRPYSPSQGRFLSRDPLGDMAFLKDYVEGKPQSEMRRLSRESLMPPYQFTHNDAIDNVDRFGLSSEPDVIWGPSVCPIGQITAFIQVVVGYIWGDGGPHVDNGSLGPKSSKSSGCPLYPLPSNMNQVFQDSPSGWTGDLQFIVCRVCLKSCCIRQQVFDPHDHTSWPIWTRITSGYKIISVGPCVYWKKGDKGDLSDKDQFTQVDGPNQNWQVGMDTDFPNASKGRCFTCSGQ